MQITIPVRLLGSQISFSVHPVPKISVLITAGILRTDAVSDLDKLSEMVQRQNNFTKSILCERTWFQTFALRLMCFGFTRVFSKKRAHKNPNKENSIMIEQFLKPQDCQEIQNICEIQIFLGPMRSWADHYVLATHRYFMGNYKLDFKRRRLDRLFLKLML